MVFGHETPKEYKTLGFGNSICLLLKGLQFHISEKSKIKP